MIFSWDRSNVEHIAKHGISPGEAQDVVEGANRPWPQSIEDDKFLVWGRTRGGRLLQVIYIFPDDEDVDMTTLPLADLIGWADAGEPVIYVVHARELTADEKTRYRKRSRKP